MPVVALIIPQRRRRCKSVGIAGCAGLQAGQVSLECAVDALLLLQLIFYVHQFALNNMQMLGMTLFDQTHFFGFLLAKTVDLLMQLIQLTLERFDLLHMQLPLVTQMLYLEADMAGFAADKPLAGPRGEAFSYSSGTTVMLSRIWQDAFADPAHALAWPREALFGPLGMTSAVLEADAGGTFVGSSYLYATARDWARFGEFLRNDGVWAGRQVLPEGFASWMREEAPASDGEYGRGQLWLRGPGEGGDAGFDLPDDAFWLLGHDGQSTAVIPSRGLVVVRLGLTPSRLGYKPQKMVEALARLYGGAPAQ